MKSTATRVLLIEDDPMVQEINKQFVEQVEGFTVIGSVSNGKEGIEFIKKEKPDLALVDIYMPNQDGVTTIKQIRSEGLNTDVIAITAASDIETVRQVLQLGAIDYIMKPFKSDRIRQALTNYRSYYVKLQEKDAITQQELDLIRFQSSKTEQKQLPKGLNALTLEKISDYLKKQSQAVSAEEVAEGIGIARVTARRYLEYMEQSGSVKIQIEYGGIGRPINRYRFLN
ncbi:chemotaxis protein CheY [Bacillus sp. SA1-12]|uniref:response regulator n=1 Tax=Bacillus sp. SA1-12 TaxID=1455638 RepID=UPI000627012E|nr:response regulator [Bacillus sp. SA1-12]KKI89929.1 chemotaxis protein CheY [Bacillus sp. SA1-12]